MRLAEDWVRAPAAVHVMDPVRAAGFEIYFVGGCVRNALLSRPVHDFDMATNARPDTVTELLQVAGLKVVATGIEHGTVTAISKQTAFEITTYRRDVETDGRHAVVAFSQDLADDAARRDFTMNALYADSDGTIVDPMGGLADLRAGRVRFIGSAEARIAEDVLRILRFFRMHAHYGDPSAGLDADGLAACAQAVDQLGKLSKERVGSEMVKLLGAADPAPVLAAMHLAGALTAVLPGADPKAVAPLVHIEGLAGQCPDWRTRAAALGGHGLGQAWRLPKRDAQTIAQLSALVSDMTPLDEIAYRVGADLAWGVALLRAAVFEAPLADGTRAKIEAAAAAVFPVRGSDLLGRFSGPALGDALRALEARWIASGFTLTKDELLV